MFCATWRAKLALDDVVAVDDLARSGSPRLRSASWPWMRRIDAGLLAGSVWTVYWPDPEDVRQRDLDRLVVRNVNTYDTRHIIFPSCHIIQHHDTHRGHTALLLALPLLVPGVRADHPHHALAADDLAVLTDSFYGTSDFHSISRLSGSATTSADRRSNCEAQSGPWSGRTATSRRSPCRPAGCG